ncbi:redoxin domain-containing protein [Micromonospora sp. ALFpr18c]|uniref:winged helix-turn-helix transcriptional regulator n=1 Tax=Micromonospora sp. ALFpr18c TaxID=1458665 RepID=UPI00124AF986|nr:winged helix-turn-helix transcriptional regulator [Micromonospora sp. ALFpr18c]KAB1941983.1 redoxin domain-containing protein [Micromonospora sp. ALFpr18c]
MRREDLADADCGIAQALGVLGDWWTFLIVRDVAGGTTRFDALQRDLGVSRRALTERLTALVEHGVLRRRPYSAHPPRHDYLLTAKGEGLLPVLIALQDWGTRHLMGDGDLTATADAASAEVRRVRDLVGRRLPEVALPGPDGRPVPLTTSDAWSVLYLFPGAYAPDAHDYPPGWEGIPGARGCTLESSTYADRHPDFRAAGARVYGISTQRPDQLAAFTAYAGLPFPLLSDQDGRFGAGLLLPVFRAGGLTRFKRMTLLVDPGSVVRSVQFPVTDPAGSVDEMLALVREYAEVPG